MKLVARRWIGRAPAVVYAASVTLSACIAPPPPASAPSPSDSCRAVVDSLNAAIPPGESLAELQARGVRLRTPLNLPPGSVTRPQQSSGAAVRLMINPDGTVMAGSPKVVKSVGEPQVAASIEAAALSMAFDIDAPAKSSVPIPFTVTHSVCVRS
jgi:hypothetical protein